MPPLGWRENEDRLAVSPGGSRLAVYNVIRRQLGVFEGPEAKPLGRIALPEGLEWTRRKTRVLFAPDGNTIYIHHKLLGDTARWHIGSEELELPPE